MTSTRQIKNAHIMSHFAVTYNTLALTVNFLFCWGKSKINLEMNTLREIPTDWKAYF